MTIFYLVRHGQVDRQASIVDPPLSAQGWHEAEQIAAYLGARPIIQIYASPLCRARETASPLAVALNLPVSIEPRLRERVNFGDLPGQTFEEFVAMWEQCNREREFVPSIGDSSRSAGGRIEEFVAAIHATVPRTEVIAAKVIAAEIVAVAHGGIIADFLRNICTPSQLAQIHSGFANQPYAGEIMRNGAITVVEYKDSGGYVVKSIASTAHLLMDN